MNQQEQIFLKKINIIPVDRSVQFDINASKLWTDINLDTFGTADKHNLYTLTGNVKLARKLTNYVLNKVQVQPHRSRCIVGDKYNKKGFDISQKVGNVQ